MQMTMRWFGPEEDKVSLEHIRQVPGVEGGGRRALRRRGGRSMAGG